MSRIITLLTDFGWQDVYSAAMKGVILNINPAVNIVDITHGIIQGDINSAAFILKQAYSYFPPHTIHLVVVDPGVGTNRRIVLVRAGDYYFIAPDNGVLKYIYSDFPDVQVLFIDNQKYFLPVSSTFHGRDIFAPTAAYLSAGVPFENFGTKIFDYNKGYVVLPAIYPNKIFGQIIYIDVFGNCVSNINKAVLLARDVKQIKIKSLIFHEFAVSYGSGKKGEPLALIGSHNNIEIAARDSNAAQKFELSVGEKIEVLLKN